MGKKFLYAACAAMLVACTLAPAGCEGGGGAGNVSVYAATPRGAAGDKAALKVNGVSVPVEEYLSAQYARFSCGTEMEICVELSESVKTRGLRVLPLRLGIQPRLEGNKLTFRLERAEKLMIKNDFGFVLMLLIDERPARLSEKERADAMNAADYGFDLSGGTDDTALFDGLMTEFQASKKETLYFPAGIYAAKTFAFKGLENKRVFLETGACLDQVMPAGPSNNRETMTIRGCKNFSILGGGMVDGRGREIMQELGEVQKSYNATGVAVGDCENLTVEGLTIRGARNWSFTVNSGANRNVAVRDLRIIAPREITKEWLDGINVTAVDGFTAEDCMAFGNDDCFASGHYFSGKIASKNYKISNYTAYTTLANGIRIGYYALYDMLDFTFTGCEFYGFDMAYLYLHELLPQSNYDKIVIQDTVIDPDLNSGYLVDCLGNVRLPLLKFKNVAFLGSKKFNLREGIHTVFEGCTYNGVPMTAESAAQYFTRPLSGLNVEFVS